MSRNKKKGGVVPQTHKGVDEQPKPLELTPFQKKVIELLERIAKATEAQLNAREQGR